MTLAQVYRDFGTECKWPKPKGGDVPNQSKADPGRSFCISHLGIILDVIDRTRSSLVV